jgi:hypothetical protein
MVLDAVYSGIYLPNYSDVTWKVILKKCHLNIKTFCNSDQKKKFGTEEGFTIILSEFFFLFSVTCELWSL